MTLPIKRPSFQWYPGDWNRDIAIKTCPLMVRGLWRELLDIMHDGDPYGHLAINGAAISDEQAARLVGCEVREYKRALAELERKNVFSRTEAGIIYSRRMVRDEEKRNKSAAGGALGAEHGIKGGSFGALGGRPKKTKRGTEGGFQTPLPEQTETPAKPPASVAVAVSSALPPTAAIAAAVPPPAAAAADLAPGYAQRRDALRSHFADDERHALAFDRHLRASRNPEGFLLDVEYAAKERPSDGAPAVPWSVIGLALHELSTKGRPATEHLIRAFAGPIMAPAELQRPTDDAAVEADMLRRAAAGEFIRG